MHIISSSSCSVNFTCVESDFLDVAVLMASSIFKKILKAEEKINEGNSVLWYIFTIILSIIQH